uniref:ORF2 n=1 Tax=Plasmopara viticola lesion associated ambiguivirus 2 TaxID=2692083 RepID=A0A6B9Q460_9VIRU|nr:ORF2 [Plasmopara viticola lesion associated ambiguivirus 2]
MILQSLFEGFEFAYAGADKFSHKDFQAQSCAPADASCKLRRQEELVSGTGLPRLRQRSKLTHALGESLQIKRGLLGAFLAGRWRPDLPRAEGPSVAAWFSALVVGGVKIVGGGLCAQGDTEKQRQPFVRLLLGDTVVTVLPGLLARLSNYSAFRKRNPTLVAALRTRAIEWCKAQGVPDVDSCLCIPGTVALAYVRSAPDEAATSIMSTVAAEESRGKTGLLHRLSYNLNPWVVTSSGVKSFATE